MKRVFFINPPFQPGKCGVSDFTSLLIGKLRDGVEPTIVSSAKIFAETKNTDACNYEDESKLSRLKFEEGDLLFVNYSGWGFHKYGVPFGLVRKIEQISRTTSARVVTYFHETWIDQHGILSGNTALKPMQKLCCSKLARLSSFVMTNSQRNCEQLESVGITCAVLATVPSNFQSEPIHRNQSKSGAVIFGRRDRRLTVINRLRRLIGEGRSLSPLGTVTIIGAGLVQNDAESEEYKALAEILPASHINITGELGAEEVTKVLSDAKYLLTDYHPKDYGKSGTIQAAMQNGSCPIHLSQNGIQVFLGEEKLSFEATMRRVDLAQDVQTRYRKNYRQFCEAIRRTGVFTDE